MRNVKLPQSLSTQLGKLVGLDWYGMAVKAVLVLAILAVVYTWGRGNGKAACEKKYAKQTSAQLEKVVAFTPVADKQTEKAAVQEARTTKKKEVYDAEVSKNQRPASCDLTDSELRAFQSLVEG
jgi:hypothetical protein